MNPALFSRRRAAIGPVLLLATFLASTAMGQKKPPAVPVDLNTATAAELQQVPGIGPATAKAIIQFRTRSGPFERVEDLLAIRGISSRKLAQMRPYVTLSKPLPRKPGA